MEEFNILFELLRAALFGKDVSEKTSELLKSDEEKIKVLNAAKKHALNCAAAYALEKTGLLTAGTRVAQGCEEIQMLSVYRYENLNYELQRLSGLFEKEKIPFIILKGAVIRDYYPEPWLRFSSDIDILVHESDTERAMSAVKDELGFTVNGKTHHDIQLTSPSGIMFELHFSLLGSDSINEATDKIIASVWDYAEKLDGFEYGCKMNTSMLRFYHIVHLAKHIKNGGCGITPFLDMFILERRDAKWATSDELIREGGLERVDALSRHLSEVYFGGKEHTESSAALSEYVLFGDIVGRVENRAAFGAKKSKNKFKNALSKIFCSYDVLKHRYPEIEKRKWLFVPYQFRRWFDILFRGNTKKSVNELKANLSVSDEKIDSVSRLRQALGL